jgi:hypothetical protein
MSKINNKIENVLYIKASGCFDSLRLAVLSFEEFLKEPVAHAAPIYYRARNYLRDAKKFYDEVLEEARRLMGPLPMYSALDFEKWRAEFLAKHHIVVVSQDYHSLRDELLANGQLVQWMGRENIERLLAEDFEPQMRGKRKLENIKVRIILDQLKENIAAAEELNKTAMERLRAAG